MTSLVAAVPFVRIEGAPDPSAFALQVALDFAEEWHARLTWTPGTSGLAALELRAPLPGEHAEGGGLPRIRITPQRGVRGAVEALSEVKVEDDVVDAAFVIHADDPALLVAAVPELKALAPMAARVTVDGEGLHVRFEDLAADAVAAAVEGALSLWHRTHFFLLSASSL